MHHPGNAEGSEEPDHDFDVPGLNSMASPNSPNIGIMENQMEKKMEHEMESIILGLYWDSGKTESTISGLGISGFGV